jgi:hypothetical protein
VTNEDGRASDPTQRANYGSHVPFEGVEAVLSGDNLVPIRLKSRDQFAEA